MEIKYFPMIYILQLRIGISLRQFNFVWIILKVKYWPIIIIENTAKIKIIIVIIVKIRTKKNFMEK